MIVWLTSKLTGAAAPYLLGGAGALVLGLLATIGWQAWQIHQGDAALADARAQHAEARAGITVCELGAAELRHDIADQNQRIADLRRERERLAARADADAVRMLTRQRNRELPEGHGPQAMNNWLRGVVAP